jgi:lipopolysaccharide export system permease protein
MTRRFETTAIKAGGVSFYRFTAPLLLLAAILSGVALALTEVVPVTNRKATQTLEQEERRSRTIRMSFVFQGDEGLVYKARRLDTREGRIDDIQVEREGTGPEFPTASISANTAQWDSLNQRWVLQHGWVRRFPAREVTHGYEFRSLHMRQFDETPDDLRAEPKSEDEMRYAELSRFVDAIERSGGTAHDLRTARAQRIAFPFACLVIVLFGMPLAHSNRRGGAPLSIGIALATTILFLIFTRISEGVGAAGGLDPWLAAWIPNAIFFSAGAVLYVRVRT